MWERKIEMVESDGSSKYLKTYNLLHEPSNDSYLREISVYSQINEEFSPQRKILEDSILMENLVNNENHIEPEKLAKSLNHLHSLKGNAHLSDMPLCFGSYSEYMRYNLGKISEFKDVFSSDEKQMFLSLAKYMDENRLIGLPVLLHGDFAFGNFANTDAGIKFFDFECAHLGQPEFDLAGALSYRIFSVSPELNTFLDTYLSESQLSLTIVPYILFDWIRRYRADLVRNRPTVLLERIQDMVERVPPEQLYKPFSVSEIIRFF